MRRYDDTERCRKKSGHTVFVAMIVTGILRYSRPRASRKRPNRLEKMNGVARYLLTSGIVLATMQTITGPIADWNARKEGAEVRVSILYRSWWPCGVVIAAGGHAVFFFVIVCGGHAALCFRR